ncbi:hypothetical protein LSH36_193g10022 [Paralvinella palmiformis]|uniref:Sulfotransferase n=1 Tax=Paralvinella palmiformis TaxID=53620 RepID=A0AAD9N5C7_9ANNE|nr:hypothetical protein LSH36_193g10022 [Paralvinella palmiformis]
MNHPHPSGFIVANGTVGVKEPNVTRFLTSVPGRVVKLVVLTYEKGRQSSLGTSSSGKCPRSFHWQEPLSRLYSSAYKMFGLAASPNAIGYDVIGRKKRYLHRFRNIVDQRVEALHSETINAMWHILNCKMASLSGDVLNNNYMSVNASSGLEACLGSRIRSVKVSTLSLSLLANVLSRDRDLIVVHVVRDPRSLMAVRNIPTPMLRIILPVTCDRMRQDIRTYHAVTRRHPRRLIQVRYEDLVAEPNKRAVRFVDLPCDFDNIDLLTLYAAKAGESRNSSASGLIERWHRSVPMGDIKKSLMDCHDVLVHYGYDIEV